MAEYKYEYAYRSEWKGVWSIHRLYQSAKAFIKAGYNYPGKRFRRVVGEWEPIDENGNQLSLMIPGPLPEREDNYVSNDPEPWVRLFSGERANHTGVNLYGSGYVFLPRTDEELGLL